VLSSLIFGAVLEWFKSFVGWWKSMDGITLDSTKSILMEKGKRGKDCEGESKQMDWNGGSALER
jgi:hypothetical protein